MRASGPYHAYYQHRLSEYRAQNQASVQQPSQPGEAGAESDTAVAVLCLWFEKGSCSIFLAWFKCFVRLDNGSEFGITSSRIIESSSRVCSDAARESVALVMLKQLDPGL